MKIYYFANIRFPTEKAHGVQIAKMCEAFGAENEVVLVLPWRFNSIKEDAFSYYSVKKNFKIKRIPSLDLIVLRIPKIGYIIQSLTFALSAWIYSLFISADVVYTRELLLARVLKNVFLELHTIPSWFKVKYLKNVSKLIVISEALRKELGRGLVVPDGVDISQFDVSVSREEARRKLSLPLNRRLVLYTGHLYSWKGADVLARAAEYLDCLIVFVGGTKEDIKKFKFKNVLVLGHRPYAEIPLFLKAADILALPNSAKEKISFWTSPMKMFEYMASKRPIVASDIPSLREILNEKNAFLVRPDSPKELARGINILLKNQELSDTIGAQAFLDVQQYDWQKRVQKIL